MSRAVREAIRTFLRYSAVAALFATACSAGSPATNSVTVSFPGSSAPALNTEVVSTPGARQLGLMYRKELASDAGMLFVFPEERPLAFWMKNTYIELDIIYLDKNYQVVSIAARATPMTETPRPSGKPAQFALEVRGGSAEAWHIGPGSTASVSGQVPIPEH